MRKWETWAIGAAWVAVATLMPMAALEPVGAPAEAAVPHKASRFAASPCEDGSPRPLLGCVAVSL